MILSNLNETETLCAERHAASKADVRRGARTGRGRHQREGAGMNVCVRIQFKPPTEEDWEAMRSLAASLTNNPKQVRMSADARPGWLVAEFTMPTEAHYKA